MMLGQSDSDGLAAIKARADDWTLKQAERAKAAASLVEPVAEDLRIVSRSWTDEPASERKAACLSHTLSAGTAAVERHEFAPAGMDGVIDAIWQCIGHRDKCAPCSCPAPASCVVSCMHTLANSRAVLGARGQPWLAPAEACLAAASRVTVRLPPEPSLRQHRPRAALNATMLCRHFVELGGSPQCAQCAARGLLGAGWQGVVFDSESADPLYNLRHETVTPDTIAALFQRHAVTHEFDHLTVAHGPGAWWTLYALLAQGFRPRLVVTAVNRNLSPTFAHVVDPHVDTAPANDCYFGGSVAAFRQLLEAYDYVALALSTDARYLYAVRGAELGSAAAPDFAHALRALQGANTLCAQDGEPCSDRRWLTFGAELRLREQESLQAAASAMSEVTLRQREQVHSAGHRVQIFTQVPADQAATWIRIAHGHELSAGCLQGGVAAKQ